MSDIRILHVDDETDIREIGDLSLEFNPGFQVRACGSGEEAIETAAEWSPYLILLDVMMPGMDSPATPVRVRKNLQTSAVPVVFMTVRAQAREIDQFLSLGAQGGISKPFDPLTLATGVEGQLRVVGRIGLWIQSPHGCAGR